MDTFVRETTFDYYGNLQQELRYYSNINISNDDTEKFLNNIDSIIEKNIFRKEIGIETFFDITDFMFKSSSIELDVMKLISELYKRVNKYKEAFITYISQRINENKINNIFITESDDDLPF